MFITADKCFIYFIEVGTDSCYGSSITSRDGKQSRSQRIECGKKKNRLQIYHLLVIWSEILGWHLCIIHL